MGVVPPPLAENPELHSRVTGVAGIAIKYSTKVYNVTTAALNNSIVISESVYIRPISTNLVVLSSLLIV